jgi:hypothetical protein
MRTGEAMIYALILLAGLSLLAWVCWRLIAIGCEEPLINQRRAKWWAK